MMNKPNQKKAAKAIRLAFFVGAIILPFILQASHLEAVKGGWRPEQANLASHLVVPALLLPLVGLVFLPFSRKGRIALFVLFVPVFALVFGIYTLDLACGKYSYTGSCF